jgi:hypothetical protein
MEDIPEKVGEIPEISGSESISGNFPRELEVQNIIGGFSLWKWNSKVILGNFVWGIGNPNVI